MVIISAPWVVPVATPIIRDGSVVVADGRIIAVGRREAMLHAYPHSAETSCPCVLMPALVNAHMHLELSFLHDRIEPPRDMNFTGWIEELLRQRMTGDCSREERVAAFTTALGEQYRHGVGLLGDIGNDYHDELYGDGDRPVVQRMLEYLAPNRKACQRALEELGGLDDRIAVTGHAPYSTVPDLLRRIKTRANRLQHIFSIHTAESPEERLFVQAGKGGFRDFLEKRNSWDGSFAFAEEGFPGTIDYFDHLGILDANTLLVHCVQVTDQELQLIKDRGSRVCLCPGSNRFLGVGTAPVEKMIALGLLPALGTDSPASNDVTDIWREMQLLAADHPSLDHRTILAMATLGGARALGRGADFGSLAGGKKASILQVASAGLMRCRDERQLVNELVSGGKPGEICWVSPALESIGVKKGWSA